MRYENIEKAVFLERPNRFIARCLIDGKTENVHVKNTGRCRELLISGTEVLLQRSSNPKCSTRFDLISVIKDKEIINMDSYAPNIAAGEFLRNGGIIKNPVTVKAEAVFGSSRLDFYVEGDGRKMFVEVKGVTLRIDGCAVFPDAPTSRGAKHMLELVKAVESGYEAAVLFVIQMKGCSCFRPNYDTDPAFCSALKEAKRCGVEIMAVDCITDENSMTIDKKIEVVL